MALQEANKAFDQLKAAYNKKDFANCKAMLPDVKLKLVQLPALPPLYEDTATAQKELLLARDALELAVLVSLKLQDEAMMERNFTQLNAFYSDTKGLIPPSKQEFEFTGLNLLRLLVQNRIAEFHTELELVPPEAQAHASVQLPVQLEQWLMAGAYNKVLSAGKHATSEFQAALMAQLTSTVRDEIASCSEQAHRQLKLADAAKLMMFDNVGAVTQYAQEHGWTVSGGTILFHQADSVAPRDLPSLDLINNALVYAKELERIV